MNYLALSIISITFILGVISMIVCLRENNVDKPATEPIIKKIVRDQHYKTD